MYTWCDLTDQLPFPIELEQLRKELEQLKDDSWLEHYDVTLSRGWKSIPLVSRQGEATGPESQRAAPYEEMQRTRLCGELPAFSALSVPMAEFELPGWTRGQASISTEMLAMRLQTSLLEKFDSTFRLKRIPACISGSMVKKCTWTPAVCIM